MDSTALGRRRVEAPYQGQLTSSSILSVSLMDDEEVEWHVIHNPDGTKIVYGYTITKKPTMTQH